MTTSKDHALSVVKVGLNLIPYVGGALASLVDDYVRPSTEEAIKKTLELLGQKLVSLEGRIDIEAVNKEDFSELFKSCYLAIIRTNREEKLNAAAALLANLFLVSGDPSKVPFEELDHLIRCIDALSIGAISVLVVARQIAKTDKLFHFHVLRGAFDELDESLVMSFLSELRSLNLVHVLEGARTQAEALIEVTPIGERFVERFIEGKM